MKHKPIAPGLFIALALVLTAFHCKPQPKPAPEETRVLFIGNSLTYFHNMPATLQEMLNETHPTIKIHQSTFPGMSLTGHITEIIESRTEHSIRTRIKTSEEITETEKKIAERKWDVVILQTGTVTILIPEVRELMTNKAIAAIKKLVSNPDCKFILFSTWPSKNTYPEQYCYPSTSIDPTIEKEKCCSPVLTDLKQEYELINQGYDDVAKKNDLIKSENGMRFYNVLTMHPEINLYEDDSHPNENGAFLNACVFYQLLTNAKASALALTGDIDPETAKLLKQIADH